MWFFAFLPLLFYRFFIKMQKGVLKILFREHVLPHQGYIYEKFTKSAFRQVRCNLKQTVNKNMELEFVMCSVWVVQ